MISNTRQQQKGDQRPSRASINQHSSQPMSNQMQSQRQPHPKSRIIAPKPKSVFKKALPYLIAGGTTGIAMGGVGWLALLS